MSLPMQSRWLISLTILLLVGCGNKKESGVVASPATTPATVGAQSAGVAKTPIAPQTSRKLVILPEAPAANELLLAVFQGESGLVTYRWEKNGELINGEERDRLAASYLRKGATITVHVKNAGANYSASVIIGNIPPVVQKVSFKNPAIHRGVDIALEVSGEDADGDDVTFRCQWFRNGSQIDMIDGITLPGDQFSRGDQISFLVTPFDGEVEGAPYQGSAITIPNAPPIFVSQPPLQFLAETYRYQAQVEDPDGDEITYALENPPPGMIINKKTGQINWPLSGLPAGTYRINIIADDAQGQKGYQEYSLTMARQ